MADFRAPTESDSVAMVETSGNKTKAAELVGLPSYQILTKWTSYFASHR